MRVFELMQELSKHPAGVEVKFCRLLDRAEIKALPEIDEGVFQLKLEIREVQEGDDFGRPCVFLDGWEE